MVLGAVGPTSSSVRLASMCRRMYDWNIVNCDVKQSIQLNSTTAEYDDSHIPKTLFVRYENI